MTSPAKGPAADEGWQPVGAPTQQPIQPPAPPSFASPEPVRTSQAAPSPSSSFAPVASPVPAAVLAPAPAKGTSPVLKIVALIVVLVALGATAFLSYVIWKKLHSSSTANTAATITVTVPSSPASQTAQPAQTSPAAVPDNKPSPSGGPVTQTSSPPPSTKQSDISIVGDWRGHWENSIGQHGDASWEVSSEWGGDIRGLWDALTFQGRRDGNVVNFSAQGGQRNCTDYQVTVVVSPQGDSAAVNYDARNHCTSQTYSGTEELELRH